MIYFDMISKEHIKLISELSDKGKLTLFQVVYNFLFKRKKTLNVRFTDDEKEQAQFDLVCDCFIKQLIEDDNKEKELQAKRRKAGLASAKKRWGYGG